MVGFHDSITCPTWTIGQDGQGFFRAVVAVLHGTMGIDTIGYYSTYAMGKDRHRIDQ